MTARDVKFNCELCGKLLPQNYSPKNSIMVEIEPGGNPNIRDGKPKIRHVDFCFLCQTTEFKSLISNMDHQQRLDWLSTIDSRRRASHPVAEVASQSHK